MEINNLVRVARGDAPADLVLRNAQLVNVYSGEIYPTDVAIQGARIAGIGAGYEAVREIDLGGGYLAPGLIDAHVHIESAMVGVRQFAAAVVPKGVTSVIADPHEITNVLGLDGIRYMFDQAKYGRLSMFVMVPSCVPATHMATAGAYLEAKDIASLQNDPWVLGLAEMMNYPGVVNEDPGSDGEDRRVQDARAGWPRAGPDGQGVERIPGRRDRLGPRVHHGRRSAGEAPAGDVHPGPRGDERP